MAFVAQLTRVPLPKHLILRQLVVSFLQKVEYSDAIENFTSELINKSQLKWSPAKTKIVPNGDLLLVRKTTKQLLKEINSVYDSVLCVDVRKLQQDQLSTLFINAIAAESRQDVNFLANECMRWSILPQRQVTIEVLEFFEKTKQLENLEKYFEFCLSLDNAPFLLKLFKVRFYWSEGNTDKALTLLDELHNVASKAKNEQGDCKDLFLHLINDAVGKKSEAVLLKLIHLIETLEDMTILEQAWTALFNSEWFSDQQLAMGLFRRHGNLRLRVSVQINYITFLSLREHNIDAVYRLVELLLSHEMMHECQKVLGLLFDYQCE